MIDGDPNGTFEFDDPSDQWALDFYDSFRKITTRTGKLHFEGYSNGSELDDVDVSNPSIPPTLTTFLQKDISVYILSSKMYSLSGAFTLYNPSKREFESNLSAVPLPVLNFDRIPHKVSEIRDRQKQATSYYHKFFSGLFKMLDDESPKGSVLASGHLSEQDVWRAILPEAAWLSLKDVIRSQQKSLESLFSRGQGDPAPEDFWQYTRSYYKLILAIIDLEFNEGWMLERFHGMYSEDGFRTDMERKYAIRFCEEGEILWWMVTYLKLQLPGADSVDILHILNILDAERGSTPRLSSMVLWLARALGVWGYDAEFASNFRTALEQLKMDPSSVSAFLKRWRYADFVDEKGTLVPPERQKDLLEDLKTLVGGLKILTLEDFHDRTRILPWLKFLFCRTTHPSIRRGDIVLKFLANRDGSTEYYYFSDVDMRVPFDLEQNRGKRNQPMIALKDTGSYERSFRWLSMQRLSLAHHLGVFAVRKNYEHEVRQAENKKALLKVLQENSHMLKNAALSNEVQLSILKRSSERLGVNPDLERDFDNCINEGEILVGGLSAMDMIANGLSSRSARWESQSLLSLLFRSYDLCMSQFFSADTRNCQYRIDTTKFLSPAIELTWNSDKMKFWLCPELEGVNFSSMADDSYVMKRTLRDFWVGDITTYQVPNPSAFVAMFFELWLNIFRHQDVHRGAPCFIKVDFKIDSNRATIEVRHRIDPNITQRDLERRLEKGRGAPTLSWFMSAVTSERAETDSGVELSASGQSPSTRENQTKPKPIQYTIDRGELKIRLMFDIEFLVRKFVG
jgi:hypothetical protein